MTTISLFSGVDISLRATEDGLRIIRTRPYPTTHEPAEISLAVDAGMLLEQDLATLAGDEVIVAWPDWPAAVGAGAASLTAFSLASHHLLQVDRHGELGRQDFRFVVRWLEGSREVAIERVGAYLRHPATDRIFHLDPRAFELLEAIDTFNATTSETPNRGPMVWSALQLVLGRGEEIGAELDPHLADHVVIVPSTFGLVVHEDGAGGVTFSPTLPGSPDSASFEASFERRLSVKPVITFERPDGKRVRVLLSPDQEEALRRMQDVRHLRGDAARAAAENPVSIFDGIAEVIDPGSITRRYGPRVIGIGPLKEAHDTQVKPTGGSVLAGMETSETGALPPLPPVAPDVPERTSVTIEVVDARTGQPAPLPIQPDQVEKLRELLIGAIARGEESVSFGDMQVTAEQALVDVLGRHIGGEVGPTEVGRSGHLYLLINDHETTLTAGLAASGAEFPTDRSVASRRPDSLHPDITLQPHQQEGVEWLEACRDARGRRGAVLADDMGLGKTLQLLAHIANQIESGAMVDPGGTLGNGPWRPVLIVAPLLLVETGVWTEEMARRFSDDGRIFQPWVVLRDEGLAKVRMSGAQRDGLGKPLLDPAKIMAHKVVITTYETMVAYQHSLAQLIDGKPMWSMVIFDEAQEVKSPKTKSSYAAKALDAGFRVAATGTPVETRLRDLWNLLDTVEPTALGTQRDFVAQFERPAMNGTPDQRDEALASLRRALGYSRPTALLLRRDKAVLRDLPSRHDHVVPCEMTEMERAITQRILAGLKAPAGRGRVLAALQQLHLASQHPSLVGNAGSALSVDDLLRTSGRLTALVESLKEIRERDEKALVFARSTESQRMLAGVIGAVFGRQVAIVNGQTGLGASGGRAGAGAMRKELLRRFRESVGFDVIVLSPFVAGVGLTLTEANHVLHYGRWWNPAVENQATDRAYRLGQKRPVHVYSYISVDPSRVIPRTLDQAVDELLRTRRELARDFLLPPSEEEEAQSIVGHLNAVPESASGPSAPVIGLSTASEVGGMLVVLAEHAGNQAVWLGTEGLFGVHCLRRVGTTLEVFRIVEQEAEGDSGMLRAGAERWRELFGAGSSSAILSARTPLGTGTAHSWVEVAREAIASGIPLEVSAIPIEPCRQVQEAVRRLT